jgi:DNA gyrase/topoisomerase IV subunit A
MAIGKETESETETESVKHVHSFSTWKTVSAATVFSAERQERVCACAEKETRTVGTALTPSIKVNMTLIPLQVKQTTTKFKVSGLANGDSIVSYTSSNPKVFTVNKNGKKKDHAVLTITLKSGLKKTVKVNVQKTAVKTKKIQGLSKTLTLKKGSSVKLKPVLKPLTSQQKLTYTSSNKKVVTVSSKGVVKAKKSGKVTITVKSGSKKVKIKVTVK